MASFALGGLATLVTQRRLLGRQGEAPRPGAVPGALAGASLFPLLPPLAVSRRRDVRRASGAHSPAATRRPWPSRPCSSAPVAPSAWRRAAKAAAPGGCRRAAAKGAAAAAAGAPPGQVPPAPGAHRPALAADGDGRPAIALPLFHFSAALRREPDRARAGTILNGLAAMVVAATGTKASTSPSPPSSAPQRQPASLSVRTLRRPPERRLKLLWAYACDGRGRGDREGGGEGQGRRAVLISWCSRVCGVWRVWCVTADGADGGAAARRRRGPPEPSRFAVGATLLRRLAAAFHGGFDATSRPRRSPKAPRSASARSPLVKRHDAPPRPAACGRLDFERAPPPPTPRPTPPRPTCTSHVVKGIIESSINNPAAGAAAAA